MEIIDTLLQKVEPTETEFIEYLKGKISQIKSVLEPQPLISKPTQNENIVGTSVFSDDVQT